MDNTSRINFKVSARTAKLIGLENFSSEEGAIIELVKNTYDADAKNCIIIFDLKYKKEKIKESGIDVEIEKFDKSNSAIYIFDNGVGMTDEIIKKQWMIIGTDNKLNDHITEMGRVKTGAKGIGRFALNRLGMLTNMLTKPNKLKQISSTSSSYEWMIDWKDFDKPEAVVGDIETILTEKNNHNFKEELLNKFKKNEKVFQTIDLIDFEFGTLIEITELNDDWNDIKIQKLFSSLELLLPPKEQADFFIDLFLLNNLEDFGAVKRAYYDDFDYKVKALYNQSDDGNLDIEITRNEFDIDVLENRYSDLFKMDQMKKNPFTLKDFKKKSINIKKPIGDLIGEKVSKNLIEKIGQFEFSFYFLKNTISDHKGEGDLRKYPYKNFDSSNRKSWLKKFGGVKIFRDDFRIRPYGENGEDWLKLGERQSQSPGGAGQRLGGYRIGPNQVAGTIKISRIHNGSLQDKSGREGLIENDEFELFKNIIKEIIALFENDRNIVMYNLSKLYDNRNKEAETLRKAIEEAERIKKEKEERENNNSNSNGNEGANSNSEENAYSEAEENIAEGLLILEKENEKKDEELRLLRSLASVGLIISSFAHEVKSLRARLIPRTKFLIEELKKHLDEKELDKNLDKDDNPFYMISLIREDDIKLKHWLEYSLNTLKVDKRERKNLNFSDYFERFKSNWDKALEQRNIKLELKKLDDNNHVIRAFEVNMDSIFNNLLSNSINAHYGYNKDEKKITISRKIDGENIEILFGDNGKGLDKKYRNNPDEIFNFNESSKVDNKGNKTGTGLGLYIVKSIITEYNNSSISIVKIDGGVTFKIIFKMK